MNSVELLVYLFRTITNNQKNGGDFIYNEFKKIDKDKLNEIKDCVWKNTLKSFISNNEKQKLVADAIRQSYENDEDCEYNVVRELLFSFKEKNNNISHETRDEIEKRKDKYLEEWKNKLKEEKTTPSYSENTHSFNHNLDEIDHDLDKINKPNIKKSEKKETSKTIPLPNAKVGEVYEEELDIKQGTITPDEDLDNYGLKIEGNKITGTPQIADKNKTEHIITINVSKQKYSLTIFAKPQWENKPSDKNAPYWKEDNACDLRENELGRLIAARCRGRSHAHYGTCCDDDFAIDDNKDYKYHLIVVSDGAGSAKFSRLGSQITVNAVKEKLCELLKNKSFIKIRNENNITTFQDLDYKKYQEDKNYQGKVQEYITFFMWHLIDATYKAQINRFNEEHEKNKEIMKDIKDLSCTLLLAFSLPVIDGWITVAYWVGDGALALWDMDKQEIYLLGRSDAGEYAGETRFLCKVEMEETKLKPRIRCVFTKNPPMLCAMTDGVSDPKFDSDNALRQTEQWRSFLQELPIWENNTNEVQKRLEEWLNFESPTHHDDRTIALFIPNDIQQQIFNEQGGDEK
ncbi:MAG: protein phosphatase 2C domain-containing protein [Neisseriaceae bacterium]|nr:protein phosphatase 2C domain-containing protein [Neisseriaceae bacterium]